LALALIGVFQSVSVKPAPPNGSVMTYAQHMSDRRGHGICSEISVGCWQAPAIAGDKLRGSDGWTSHRIADEGVGNRDQAQT
jgi:hypothetical protein